MIKSHLKVFFLKKKIYYNRNKKEKKVERKRVMKNYEVCFSLIQLSYLQELEKLELKIIFSFLSRIAKVFMDNYEVIKSFTTIRTYL